MYFTQIPVQYAPLGVKAIYAFANDREATTDIRIIDAKGGTLLGAKRFAGVTATAFDAAPYLQRAVHFIPAGRGTGFCSAADRTVTAHVEAEDSAGAVINALPRTFLPCEEAIGAPALLSSMPRVRLMAPDECEELTLLTDGVCTVTVTGTGGDTPIFREYRVAAAGLQLFRLDARDFPGARELRVDAGPCGAVVYALIAAPQGARRLAWRSRAGSVEHYTFPVERSAKVTAVKKQICGPEGHEVTSAVCEQRTVLSSAYESRAVLEALAGLLTTPQVWQVRGDEYVPVRVISDEAVVHRQGVMSLLELEICPKQFTGQTWI